MSLFFEHGYLRPAGSGFRELAGGEAPDDDLLAFDPFDVLGGFAVKIRADGGRGGAFHRDAFDGHGERGGEVFAEAGLLREHVAAGGEDERMAVAEEQHWRSIGEDVALDRVQRDLLARLRFLVEGKHEVADDGDIFKPLVRIS